MHRFWDSNMDYPASAKLPIRYLICFAGSPYLHFPFWEPFFIFTENNLRVIAKKSLRDFWEKHPDCGQQLKAWYQEAEDARWKGPNDIKRDYPSASFLAENRVVFHIKGNSYQQIVKINYPYGMVWIRFVGTHAQYDKIDATTI